MARRNKNKQHTSILSQQVETLADIWDAMETLKNRGVNLGTVVPSFAADENGLTAIVQIDVYETLDVRDRSKTWSAEFSPRS